MADIGVRGVEALYKTHTEEEERYFTHVAEEMGMFITRGSDYHGDD